MDGFPLNYNQAKILEKALTGFDSSPRETPKEKTKENAKQLKPKKSSLAPDPRPAPPPPEPSSGIDVVILFDAEDEICLRRAAGRKSKSLN